VLFHLNAYRDQNASNAPNLNNLKWSREIQGIDSARPLSDETEVASGETRIIFDGSRTLAHDGTTQYSLTLKPSSANTYILAHVGGTAPLFREQRTTGADNTTEVTVTKNGNVLTFASTGGTALSLLAGGVVVGDYARIGSLFASANQGEFKVLALTATSFQVENELGAAEGPITLGGGFAAQINIYSAAGVQKGDKLKISGGFSPVSRKVFEITAVTASYIEFYSADVLPEENPITTNALSIYTNAKKFLYLESDQPVQLTINGAAGDEIEPLTAGAKPSVGFLVRTSAVWSLAVTNNGSSAAKLYLATVE